VAVVARVELEPTLTLSARDCYDLGRFLQLDVVRREVRSDPRRRGFHDLLIDVLVVARAHAEAEEAAATSAVRQSSRQLAAVGPELTVMSTSDVADFIGTISERGVRDAAQAGRLRGTRDGRGRWWFEPDAVATFKSTRGAA
jgi:hypothetical protein